VVEAVVEAVVVEAVVEETVVVEAVVAVDGSRFSRRRSGERSTASRS
jgi:hypothetical protein